MYLTPELTQNVTKISLMFEQAWLNFLDKYHRKSNSLFLEFTLENFIVVQ